MPLIRAAFDISATCPVSNLGHGPHRTPGRGTFPAQRVLINHSMPTDHTPGRLHNAHDRRNGTGAGDCGTNSVS